MSGILSLSDTELTPGPHSCLLRGLQIRSLTGWLSLSTLGYPISNSTPQSLSGKAELGLISRGTSYHRTRLALKRKAFQLNAFLPLIPGHPNGLNPSTGYGPPSGFRLTSSYPGLDRPVSGLTPVTWGTFIPTHLRPNGLA